VGHDGGGGGSMLMVIMMVIMIMTPMTVARAGGNHFDAKAPPRERVRVAVDHRHPRGADTRNLPRGREKEIIHYIIIIIIIIIIIKDAFNDNDQKPGRARCDQR